MLNSIILQILISGGETEWGHILSTETYPNLRLIFKEYERLASKTVEEAIDDQFSGDIKKAFQAVGKHFYNV